MHFLVLVTSLLLDIMGKSLILYDAFDLSCFADYTNCMDFVEVYAASYASSIV